MKKTLICAVVVMVLAVMFSRLQKAQAISVVYTDEASYLSAVNSYGYDTIFEGFEGSDWDITRPDGIPVSLTTQGVTWMASENLKTSSGWVRTGSYGVFDSWGEPDIISALAGTAQFYGIGGYFDTATSGQHINMEIANQVVATLTLDSSYGTHQFLGIIDTEGFASVTFRNLNEHFGADDFIIAIPEPGMVCLLGLGGLALAWRRRQ